MKSPILTLLMLAFLLMLGCAYQTYDELEAEYRVTGDSTKLEKRERQLEKAETFFLIKAACAQSNKHLWFCPRIYGGGRLRGLRSRDSDTSIDGTVRRYQTERAEGCQCIPNSSSPF